MGTPWAIVKQEDDKIPGDIGGSAWVRYDDEGEKAYKLNVERQNGRGAMLGITGCLIHELLGVDALYPVGGYDGAARSRSSTASTPSRGSPRSLRREPGCAMQTNIRWVLCCGSNSIIIIRVLIRIIVYDLD